MVPVRRPVPFTGYRVGDRPAARRRCASSSRTATIRSCRTRATAWICPASLGSNVPERPGDLATEVRRIAERGAACGRGTGPGGRRVTRRCDGSTSRLRVAIAGRVKAGKSTLLNALVGERLAATDAGECTRIVTWYRRALGLSRRRRAPCRRARESSTFRREDGALDIDLGDVAARGDRAHRGRLAVAEADRPDADRHARPGLDRRGDSERTMHALVDDDADGPGRRMRSST